MLRRLYDWTISLAGSRHAMWALAAVAFIESSVFPIPPDLLMIPMIIARPSRAFQIASAAAFGITPSSAWASAAWASISNQMRNFVSGDQIATISGRE